MKRKRTAVTIAVVALVTVMFAVAVVLVAGPGGAEEHKTPETAAQPVESAARETQAAPAATASTAGGFDAYFSASRVYAASDSDIAEALPADLGNGLTIENIGFFNGVFVEDGSMTMVYNVLAIVVKNSSDECLERAEITIPHSACKAVFAIEMLPAGQSAIVLEKSADDYAGKLGSDYLVDGVTFARQLNELPPDALAIDAADGVVTVTNVSGKSITGDITIHYKYYLDNTILGGADFSITIEGGLADGQVQTVMAGGYSAEACGITAITLD